MKYVTINNNNELEAMGFTAHGLQVWLQQNLTVTLYYQGSPAPHIIHHETRERASALMKNIETLVRLAP